MKNDSYGKRFWEIFTLSNLWLLSIEIALEVKVIDIVFCKLIEIRGC